MVVKGPLFDFKPFEPESLNNPYPLYERARRHAPVFYWPTFNRWVVVRHRDVEEILSDQERFSSREVVKIAKEISPQARKVLSNGYPETPRLIDDDPPGHERARSLVDQAFTSERIAAIEPVARSVAKELLSLFAPRGRGELIADLARPFALRAMAELIGAPLGDIEKLERWALRRSKLRTVNISPDEQLECATAIVQFQRYLGDLVRERQSKGQDDLISALVGAFVPGRLPLNAAEIVGLLEVMISKASATVPRLLANALLLWLKVPERWQALEADPRLIEDAIEEAIRLEPPLQCLLRTTNEIVDVRGVTIPRNAQVLVMLGAANRDEAIFGNADRYEPTRGDKKHHLAFGAGIHSCPGAGLSRLLARTFVLSMIEALPGLRLLPDEPIVYDPDLPRRGPQALWLGWDDARKGE